MSTVFVVVRQDNNEDVTTVERVFQDGMFTSGHTKALEYIDGRYIGPGIEFFIEEMPVY